MALVLTLAGWDVLMPHDELLLTASGAMAPLRRRRGRPRKFDEPSRVVSLTLPESVIGSLSRVNEDLGHAVAGLIQDRTSPALREPAELVTFGSRAVISVRPSRLLEQYLGVSLVPLPDGRALIALDEPRSVADLELRIHDLLDEGVSNDDVRATLEGLRSILREARRSADVVLVPRNIIVLETRTSARRRLPADEDEAAS
ncbi:hypothetical protein TBR22_A25030 [Luteitalea sp. TBR-22]|nr:hypothetical protein TBR22_A25030 [Luteitalea sp. TBR-22]